MSNKKSKRTAVLVDVKKGEKMVVEFEGLEDLYKLMDCRLVEVVHAKVGGFPVDIIIDEEGRLHEQQTVSGLCTNFVEHLVGNLVVVGFDGKEDWRSLTANETDAVMSSIFTREHTYTSEPIPTLVYERNMRDYA